MTASPRTAAPPYVQTQSVTLFPPSSPFRLEGGGILSPVTVAYETYGTLNAARDNAVLVCHALTGSAHAAGFSSPDPHSEGWWDPMIGPGRPLDTSRYFVISSNFLGGCYGTTGPTSTDPETGEPFAMTFPEYTVRDMVRLQKALLDHLGVARLRTIIGGSLGGMQVLEWPLLFPDMVTSIIPIATATRHSPWCIGLNDLSRQAIMLDPAWKNGAYDPAVQPARGLSIARQIAMMSYRSDISFQERFRRERVDSGDSPGGHETPNDSGSQGQLHLPDRLGRIQVPLSRVGRNDIGTPDSVQQPVSNTTRPDRATPAGVQAPRFQVERYLRYQGQKLVDRFDANTYLYITWAMGSHDVAAGRGQLEDVLGSLRQPALCVGISSDILYPAHEQRAIAAALPHAHYRELDAPYGHDSFLISYDLLGPLVREFLEELA